MMIMRQQSASISLIGIIGIKGIVDPGTSMHLL